MLVDFGRIWYEAVLQWSVRECVGNHSELSWKEMMRRECSLEVKLPTIRTDGKAKMQEEHRQGERQKKEDVVAVVVVMQIQL